MANSFTFDGTAMLTTYGLYLKQVSQRAGLPDIRSNTFDLGQRHGVHIVGQYFKPRYYTLECVLSATDADTLMTRFDAIKALMDPRNGVKLITFDEDVDNINVARDRGIYAMVHGPFNEQRRIDYLSFQVNLIVPSGMTVAASATTQTLTISTAPQTFLMPSASGTTIAGNTETLPVWVIKNTSGSASACWLKNTTRSEDLYINSIDNNEWIEVDCDNEWVRASTDSGATWTHCENRLADTSGMAFPLLTGGVQNTIQTTILGTGSVVATYRARWL